MSSPQAVSYVRFSSGIQAKGSSLDRQFDVYDRWLSAHPEYENSPLSKTDEGVSAYKKDHLKDGKGLSELLAHIRSGDLKSGDAIVVEAIDRLSRADFFTTLRILEEILGAGISIYTLEDGAEYTSKSVNGSQVYVLIAKAQAAHEYSKRLGERIYAAYESKRRKARSGEKIRISTPFWLQTSGELKPDASKLVLEAIDLYLAGNGTRHIAKLLSEKSEDLKNLNPSTIKRWFSNRAIIGEWENKGEPISGVFEPLIPLSKFIELQSELERRTKNPAPADKYELSGFVWCARCGSKFQTRRQKPKATKQAPLGSPEYLAKPVILYCNCKSYLQKDRCDNNATWSYDVLLFIYRRLATDALISIAEGRAFDNRNAQLDELVAQELDLTKRLERLSDLYELTELPRTRDKVYECNTQLRSLRASIEQLQESIKHDNNRDAKSLSMSYEEFTRGQENLSASVQMQIDDIRQLPSMEIANLIKKYDVKILIDGKRATTPYDGYSYSLLSRSQKFECYLVESINTNSEVGGRFHAIGKDGRQIVGAFSLDRLTEKLSKRLDSQLSR